MISTFLQIEIQRFSYYLLRLSYTNPSFMFKYHRSRRKPRLWTIIFLQESYPKPVDRWMWVKKKNNQKNENENRIPGTIWRLCCDRIKWNKKKLNFNSLITICRRLWHWIQRLTFYSEFYYYYYHGDPYRHFCPNSLSKWLCMQNAKMS